MSEAESQVLTVVLSNDGLPGSFQKTFGDNSRPSACEATMTLAAPDFNLGPPETSQTIRFPPGKDSARPTWVLSPKKAGTFRVVVSLESATSERDAAQIGITVHTVLGLTPMQAELLSRVGSVLGPMLTIPWWASIISKWRARRENMSQSRETPTEAEARTSDGSGTPGEQQQVAPGQKGSNRR